jgi:predicted dehydrogenase
MATTIEACESMIATAERTSALLSVGFCHRFQPHVERLKEIVAEGTLGKVLAYRNRFAGHLSQVENTWFSNPAIAGGGVLFDTLVHSVDLFRFVIGEPVQVQAVLSTSANDLGPALEVEDTAIVTLRTSEGTLGSLEASWRTPPGEWIVTLYGTAGTATIDYAADELRVQIVGEKGWRVIDVEPGIASSAKSLISSHVSKAKQRCRLREPMDSQRHESSSRPIQPPEILQITRQR